MVVQAQNIKVQLRNNLAKKRHSSDLEALYGLNFQDDNPKALKREMEMLRMRNNSDDKNRDVTVEPEMAKEWRRDHLGNLRLHTVNN